MVKINAWILIKYLIIINSIQISFCNKIKLRIRGIREAKVLGKSGGAHFDKKYFPNFTYINSIQQNSVDYQFNFSQSDNLVELVWNNKISDCHNMFLGCKDILEIDLSEFDSSEVTSIQSMFNKCTSLISVNFANFDTSNVNIMFKLFYNCSSLKSLNLDNFNTSKVTNMTSMFDGCISLTSLNLSNFDFSKVTSVNKIFNNNNKLEYINILNIRETEIISTYENMFQNVPENIAICINKALNQNHIFPQLSRKVFYIIDCSDDWKTKQKKIITESGIYAEKNSHFIFIRKCYINCGDENSNDLIYKCKYENESYNSSDSNSINLCNRCNNNSYPKEDEFSDNYDLFSCYINPKHYYLDEYSQLYKKCYPTCETCNMKGTEINHNCLECNANYSVIKYFNNSMNCYENCNYYYYFENEINIHCTNGLSCPDEYPYLLGDSRECIKNDINTNIFTSTYDIKDKDNEYSDLPEIRSIIQDILNQNNITIKNESKEKDEEINKYNLILEKMESIILTGSFNISKIYNGNDEIINAEKMIITLTSLDNQKINKNNNITSIDFGQCESILINNYSKKDLYIKIIQVSQEGMKIPKIEYDVYNKISPSNFKKLNLTEICGDNKIFLSIPMELTENLDKLNSSSGYYNDICYTTISDSGTDITLKDRKREYIDKNITICQDDCDFSEYNYRAQKVICSCNVKESSLSFNNICIDKSKLLKNFIDIKNIANLNILICYKNLLYKNGIIKNIGSYIILIIILFHIICIFIFI